MSEFSQLEAANAAYVETGRHRPAAVRPTRRLAVVTCMDARIDVPAQLGIAAGQAHVLRTAGGRVTEDVLRSLALSTHLLGTRNIAVITHTGCGLHDPAGDVGQRVAEAAGRPVAARDWGAFADPAEAAAADARALRDWPDRPEGLRVAAYVLDVDDARLHKVLEDGGQEPEARA